MKKNENKNEEIKNKQEEMIDEEQPVETENKASEEVETESIKVNNQEFEKLKRERDEYLSHLQRLKAEFDNFKRRSNKEKIALENFCVSNFIKGLLPILSDFERAFEHDDVQDSEFSKGIRLIFGKYKDFLKKSGLEELDAKGKDFDPDFHDALNLIPVTEGKDNIVIEEYEKGYKYKDIIIQHSKVSVSKLVEKEENKDEKEADKNNGTKKKQQKKTGFDKTV